jgi:RecD/TraA family predicted helicase
MLQKLLVDLLEELNLSYIALSPTGKAAKILSSYMSRPVQTIHRAIGYGMDKERQQLISVPNDFIIVDEFGMSDVFVTSGLLSKITNKNARILFIGDPAQIPSVSAGNVLHDMLESGVIPKTQLTVVFRQSEGGILDIASRVREGQPVIPYNFSGKKVFGTNLVLHCVNSQEMERGYRHYYDYFLKSYAPEDILVLSPKKMGDLGTVAINKYIQSVVNPPGEDKKEHQYGEVCVFRVGDYVINTKNTYEKPNMDGEKTDIVNGDTGTIVDIVKEIENNETYKKSEDEEQQDQRGIIVDYDADMVRMTFGETGQLLHSWCLTYHKSQGGSAKAVLVIADKSNAYQLNSNLIYVALTRAVEKCVVLTQSDTLNNALKKFENMKRQTFLGSMFRLDNDDTDSA